ncbi:hypothetical protein EV191_1172 [Tamaricihabitans halophyticus]|uniref:Uncharacterized protein n=1 Tax=Tamaricihabitans halophyticus TaxID=1262583 RepID=A0A4V2SS12_9PSEU|nr:hypothetical protein [Tamaricihabitans halophyticus]TCP45036.1 hypothetical protein EV191_1172 [Tamaricihabitans halophyticus]
MSPRDVRAFWAAAGDVSKSRRRERVEFLAASMDSALAEDRHEDAVRAEREEIDRLIAEVGVGVSCRRVTRSGPFGRLRDPRSTFGAGAPGTQEAA